MGFRIKGTKASAEEVADALMAADPRMLADVLEALGMRAELVSGASQFLGPELRRLSRDLRSELSETTVVDARTWRAS